MSSIETNKAVMQLSTTHNFMEIMVQTEEKVEAEAMAIEPMEDQSTETEEETCCSTMRATLSTSPEIHKQFMLSNHQL